MGNCRQLSQSLGPGLDRFGWGLWIFGVVVGSMTSLFALARIRRNFGAPHTAFGSDIYQSIIGNKVVVRLFDPI